MGTDKRDRKKANRQAKLAAEQAVEARRRQLKFIRNAVLLVVGIIVVGFLLAGCGTPDEEVNSAGTGTSQTTDGGTETPVPPAGDLQYGPGECPPAEGSPEPVITFDDAPKQCIDPAKDYTATVQTSEGTFEVLLDTERTPLTTNNFVVLARYGYYDGTDLFRVEAGSGIIQGGSPHTQSNTDPGPGYTIPDEGLPFTPADYGPGTLAMARTSEPNSASAQFFVLASEGGRYLGDPEQVGPSAGTYAVFGKTTKGLDVLQAITALDTGSRVPSKQVTIDKVTITES